MINLKCSECGEWIPFEDDLIPEHPEEALCGKCIFGGIKEFIDFAKVGDYTAYTEGGKL